MTNKQEDLPIIFFGTEDYSLITLKTLVESKANIVAVVTKPDAPKGRGHKLTAPPVKIYATEHNIPVWQPNKLHEISNSIKQLQPVAGVLVAYGKIIPQSTLDLFTPGIINVHPSLLPLWRGPSPIESAILNRDTETGVTIMKLEAGMDSGPIYAQEKIPLELSETKYQLYDKLFNLGSNMLVDSLQDIFTGKLQPTPQDDSSATYCSMLSKEDSIIDPTEVTADQAEAQVRAYLGFPKSRIQIDSQTLIITKALVENEPSLPLSVKCKDDKYLTIAELIAPSGKNISSEDYLRGYAK